MALICKTNLGRRKKLPVLNELKKDVASQTGLSQQMVSKIESFNGNPSMLSFLKYCNCIGVDVNYPPPKGSGLLLNGSPD